MQMPVFSSTTKGQWSLRFEDILANALDQGPLRCTDMELPDELMERLRTATPKEIPMHMVTAVVAYYIANKPNDSDIVLRIHSDKITMVILFCHLHENTWDYMII